MSSRRATAKAPHAETTTRAPFEPLTQREIARRIECVAEALGAGARGREPWAISPRDLVSRLREFVVMN